MVAYAVRPAQLSGCWSSWQENDAPQTIRTNMDVGPPKVRRRYTGVYRLADASGPIPAELLPTFDNWFRVICQAGVMPTNVVMPNGQESVWRFVEPPVKSWDDIEGRFVTVSVKLEKLPGWQDL